MKFFLDTANIEEVNEGLDAGLVDGITTNKPAWLRSEM